MPLIFFKIFTAKEAVLKACGIGLKGISKIKVVNASNFFHTILEYNKIFYTVEHFILDSHLASVVKHNTKIIWETYI